MEDPSKMTVDELRGRASRCSEQFDDSNVSDQTKEHLAALAQFYLGEIDRRDSAKIARRDYKLEVWVIVLIGLELVLAVVAIITGWIEANKQMSVLDKLNESSAATAGTLTALRDAQEASLETQKQTLENIVAMNTALQDELGLNYAISVVLTYDDGQRSLNLFNNGKTNIWLWGTKLSNQRPTLEKEGRVIAPTGYYYFDFTSNRQEFAQKLPKGSESRIPFDVYLKTANGKPYVVETLLVASWQSDALQIRTQITSVRPSKW
jgi:hypothetical protein